MRVPLDKKYEHPSLFFLFVFLLAITVKFIFLENISKSSLKKHFYA